MRPFAQPGSFHNVFDETTNERESHETSSLQQNPPFPSSCKGSYPSRYTHDQTTKRPRLSSNIAMKTSGGSSDDTSLLSVINSSSDTITEMRSASACEPFPLYQSTSAQDIREKSESLLAFLDLAAADPLLNGDTTTVTNKVPVPLLSLSESSTNKSTNQANSHRKRPIPSKDEMMDELSIDEEDEDESSSRFRGYQEKQWEENFKALVQFHSEHGHCRVPHNFQQNPALARWVKRQRFQYKRLQEGFKSTLIESRLEALINLGFVWDSHTCVWEDRLYELKQFSLINGHCNVPSTYSPNPKLSTWVKSQRRQYKLLVANKKSTLTSERVNKLNEIGFQWNVEGYSRIQPSSSTKQRGKP